MKGIVFTEFLDMVEDKFGIEVVDHIIENSELESGGVYTTVGTYSHFEMVSLVTELSKKLDIPIGDLLKVYAVHFFDVLLKSYPQFFEKQKTAFGFLASIDNYIHPEVLKLYPDAELPRFDAEMKSDKVMHLKYYSSRKLSDFASGLIQGTLNHYDEGITMKMESLVDDNSEVLFILEKK